MERHTYNHSIRRHSNNSHQHHQQQQINPRRLPPSSNQSQPPPPSSLQQQHHQQQQQQHQQQNFQQNYNSNQNQHDEIINFIKDAWQIVNDSAPVFFYPDHTRVPEFTPFDLEGFWGQKLIQNIHVNQGHP